MLTPKMTSSPTFSRINASKLQWLLHLATDPCILGDVAIADSPMLSYFTAKQLLAPGNGQVCNSAATKLNVDHRILGLNHEQTLNLWLI